LRTLRTTTITELPDLVSWCDEGAYQFHAEIFFRISEPLLSPPHFISNAGIIFSIDSDADQVVPVLGNGAWMPFQGVSGKSGFLGTVIHSSF
jgi:hypothetical protein